MTLVLSSDHVSEKTGAASARGLVSVRALWGGRVMSALAVLFLGFDAVGKLALPKEVVETTTALGYPFEVIRPLGLVQMACLALYLFPRTSVFGAILWTGYLGGAIATHVRVQNPLATHVLFPIYIALLLWGGLWLRNPALRALLSPRAPRAK